MCPLACIPEQSRFHYKPQCKANVDQLDDDVLFLIVRHKNASDPGQTTRNYFNFIACLPANWPGFQGPAVSGNALEPLHFPIRDGHKILRKPDKTKNARCIEYLDILKLRDAGEDVTTDEGQFDPPGAALEAACQLLYRQVGLNALFQQSLLDPFFTFKPGIDGKPAWLAGVEMIFS